MSRTTSRVALAGLFALAGCADELESESATAQTLRGLTSVVRLQVTGPEASRDKEAQCRRIAEILGVRLSENATFSIRLHLRDDGNRLIFTASDQELGNFSRPGWSMDHLCRDAFVTGARVVEETRRRPAVVAPAPVVASVAAPPVAGPAAAAPRAPLAVAAAPPAPARQPAPPRDQAAEAGSGWLPDPVLTIAATPPRPQIVLQLRSVPPGARLVVDRAPAGTAPVRAEQVPPGIHVIEAWWPDGHFAIRRLRIARFGSRVIELRGNVLLGVGDDER